MGTVLRTKTALIIALAFILRIVSVNLFILAPFNNSQTNKLSSSFYSSIIKKRRNADKVTDNIPRFVMAELCEESDTEEESGSHDQAVLFTFIYTFLQEQPDLLLPNKFSETRSPGLSSRRHLALSILRI